MKKKIRNLWIKALEKEDGAAYRELGFCFLFGKGTKREKKLGRVCLEKAMGLGDTEGFILYHSLFSKGKQVFEDADYEALVQEWKDGSAREGEHLEALLDLGTEQQKRIYWQKR